MTRRKSTQATATTALPAPNGPSLLSASYNPAFGVARPEHASLDASLDASEDEADDFPEGEPEEEPVEPMPLAKATPPANNVAPPLMGPPASATPSPGAAVPRAPQRPAPRRVSADVVKAETKLIALDRRRAESLAHHETVWAQKRALLIASFPGDVLAALEAIGVLQSDEIEEG